MNVALQKYCDVYYQVSSAARRFVNRLNLRKVFCSQSKIFKHQMVFLLLPHER